MKRIFEEFARSEAIASILLLIATVVALVWANSPWQQSYFELLHAHLGIVIGGATYTVSLENFINDGLMVIFFLVVGLEVKREILVGELSSVRKAMLPVAAALGGMLVPAVIYLAFNWNEPGMRGWGIPMATDIAFSLGVLALLGSRVPTSLKVFLTALAIADDIGAVLVIAVFYSTGINFVALVLAAVLVIALYAANRAGLKRTEVYVILAVGVWLAVLASGIHATIAGILIAFTIPVSTRVDPRELVQMGRLRLQELEEQELTRDSMIHDREQMETITALHEAAGAMRPTGLVLEEYFHPILVWFILPLFALFNAGIHFDERIIQYLTDPVTLGIVFGLVVGKQVGVTLFSWLTVRSNLGNLPEGVTWKHIYGTSWLCGMGFTMSLFITVLAFTDQQLIDAAKLGVLIASLIAGIVGYILLRRWLSAPSSQPVASQELELAA